MSQIQYTSLVGPVQSSTPYETLGASWKATYPDRVSGRRPLTHHPSYVESLVFSVPYETLGASWRPVYPDWVARRLFHPALQQPDGHRRLYFDPPQVVAAPGGMSPAVGSLPILQYQGIAQPFFATNVAPDVVRAEAWAVQLPSKVWPSRGLHASQQVAWVSDRFDAPTAAVVTALSWSPRYPDQLYAKRRVAQDLEFTAEVRQPTPPLAPDSSWQTFCPYQRAARPSTHYLLWAQQHFGVEYEVPVMSWTGWFPDLIARPRYQHLLGYVGAPGVVPDVTQPTTPHSWDPEYVGQVWAQRRLNTASQQAFAWRPATFDPTAAPDQFYPSYPDLTRAYLRAALTGGTFDIVQLPDVPRFGVDPVYPDFIPRRIMLPSGQMFESWGVFTPAPPPITPGTRRIPNYRRPFRMRFRR